MVDLKRLVKQLEENEETARRFHAVETRILSILNFKDLFEVLLSEIRTTFRIPYVWLSLVETSDVSRLMQSLASSEQICSHINRVKKQTFKSYVGQSAEPILINTRIESYAPLFPPFKIPVNGSMALVPISLDGDIIGSLNCMDVSPARFEPDMDTSLLKQLAVKFSLCLSNVTAHERLSFFAYHDPLTGLLNRRVMEDILAREFKRSQRYQRVISVVFIDLDDFKPVNDTYGHDIGDALLKYVSHALELMTRETDIVARFGGDEFVVICTETGLHNAERLIDRARTFLAEHPFRTNGITLPVSISFGVACSGEADVTGPEKLLKNADKRLYQAKKQKSGPKRKS